LLIIFTEIPLKPLSLPIILLTLACAPAPPNNPPTPTATSADATTETGERATFWPSPLATPPPERSEIRQLRPVDHALRDREFARFRDELLIATRAKNHAVVLGALNPKIRTSFGKDGGVEHFITIWHPEDPDSALWTELESVIELGGSFRESNETPMFCSPYPYSEWPEDLDAFEHLVVIRPGTALKASRDPASTEETPLGYEFLRIASDDPVRAGNRAATWRKVTTADGKEGWVDAYHVRSPIGYRACFSRHPEGWKMDLFVAGD
jgi:hypothetical protein